MPIAAIDQDGKEGEIHITHDKGVRSIQAAIETNDPQQILNAILDAMSAPIYNARTGQKEPFTFNMNETDPNAPTLSFFGSNNELLLAIDIEYPQDKKLTTIQKLARFLKGIDDVLAPNPAKNNHLLKFSTERGGFTLTSKDALHFINAGDGLPSRHLEVDDLMGGRGGGDAKGTNRILSRIIWLTGIFKESLSTGTMVGDDVNKIRKTEDVKIKIPQKEMMIIEYQVPYKFGPNMSTRTVVDTIEKSDKTDFEGKLNFQIRDSSYAE